MNASSVPNVTEQINLNEEFIKRNYVSLIKSNEAEKFKLELDYLIDKEHQDELYDVYLSELGDELYVVLRSDKRDSIHELCNRWDEQISRFVVFGSNNSRVTKKFKHNIVMIILMEDSDDDLAYELPLHVSRKIVIKCTYVNEEAFIKDVDAVELPFYLIPSNNFQLDNVLLDNLDSIMPDKENMFFLYEHITNKRKTDENDFSGSFTITQYNDIKGWLNNANKTSNN